MIKMMTAAIALALVAGAAHAEGGQDQNGDNGWHGRRGSDSGDNGGQDKAKHHDGGQHNGDGKGQGAAQVQVQTPPPSPPPPPPPQGGRSSFLGRGAGGAQVHVQSGGETHTWSGHHDGGSNDNRSHDQGAITQYNGGAQYNGGTRHGDGDRGGDNHQGDQRWNGGQSWDGHRGGYQPGAHQPRARDRGRPWYDNDRYRESYRATHRFRIRPYIYPRGWFARRWAFGQILPYGWYSSNYYLDAYAFGLPQPPIGCEWVRVGNDAVLVDIWSGEILSVYYDLFW